jgi:hypothetical protein
MYQAIPELAYFKLLISDADAIPIFEAAASIGQDADPVLVEGGQYGHAEQGVVRRPVRVQPRARGQPDQGGSDVAQMTRMGAAISWSGLAYHGAAGLILAALKIYRAESSPH